MQLKRHATQPPQESIYAGNRSHPAQMPNKKSGHPCPTAVNDWPFHRRVKRMSWRPTFAIDFDHKL